MTGRRPSLAAVDDLEEPLSRAEAVEAVVDAEPFTGWAEPSIDYGDDIDVELYTELEPARVAVEVMLAEAGYPEADVYLENGIMVDGAPAALVDRALELLRQTPPRALP